MGILIYKYTFQGIRVKFQQIQQSVVMQIMNPLNPKQMGNMLCLMERKKKRVAFIAKWLLLSSTSPKLSAPALRLLPVVLVLVLLLICMLTLLKVSIQFIDQSITVDIKKKIKILD